jgi:PqqD family protein of HPr-rel-A system
MLTGMREGALTISSKWCSQSPDDIVWVVLDGEFVVYHRPSGKTHFLNAASQLLICDILRKPRDFAGIANEFASSDTDDHPDIYLEEMRSLLNRLEALGLVERV